MENILEINGLKKSYGSLTAVENLQLKVGRGSVFGLLGPNGSGKTTTLGMVLGVTKPTTGNYRWFGKPLDFESKQKIGAILETPNFYPYMTAQQNLELVAKVKEVPKSRISEVLEQVNLSQRANSKFKAFSLGMKQRLAIASALLCQPEVLVLDEPTNGLDPQGIAEIRALIKNISEQGITIIIASHLLDEIEKVCTHAAVLKFGKLLFSGSVAELTGQEGIIEIASEDNTLLKATLGNHSAIGKIEEKGGLLILQLTETLATHELNKYLAQNNQYASHLVYRKTSLETQFLNLTQA